MGLYSEVFNFLGKDKIKKYMGLSSGFFFDVCSICNLYLTDCTFAPILKFGPVPSKNPRCAPESNNENGKAMYETCSNLTINTPELR